MTRDKSRQEWDKMTPEQQQASRQEREQESLRPLNELLQRIKAKMPELEKQLAEVEDHWGGEDLFYRYYHHSYKVYSIQGYTKSIVELLRILAPNGVELNKDFMEIIRQGTEKKFALEHNQHWANEVRPMLEAFFHAREMLRLMIKYGKTLNHASGLLESGWAAVLYLYNLR